MSEIFPNKTWMNVKNAVKSWSWIRFQSISLPLLLNHLWCDLGKEWLYSGVQVYWTLTCHNFVPVFLLAICPAHFLFPELQLPSFFPPFSPWVSQSLSGLVFQVFMVYWKWSRFETGKNRKWKKKNFAYIWVTDHCYICWNSPGLTLITHSSGNKYIDVQVMSQFL